ncbi:MAG: hypothetical protein JKX73_02785 [Flavobacteriales bacterium]|nr:hypothetical protein [Flavobacteriales bacterium]
MFKVRSAIFFITALVLSIVGARLASAQEVHGVDVNAEHTKSKNIEKGFLPIRNYSSLEYGARPQNWALVRDQRGLMYVGNNKGILEYDGTKWRLIMTPDEETVRSLAIDSSGIIYVGTQGDIGYLSPDSVGRLQYRSLLHLLHHEKDREFWDVWRTIVTDEGVYYQTSDIIFLLHDDTIKTWHAEGDKTFHLMFHANETVYVRQRGIGLKKMIDGQLVVVQGGEVFPEEKIYFMTDFYHEADEEVPRILLNTRSQGLFTMYPTPTNYYPKDRHTPEHTNKIVPFKTDIDEFLIENLIYNGIRLKDKHSLSVPWVMGLLYSIKLDGCRVC